MVQELILETHHKPSMLNKEMVIGGLAGFLIPGVGIAVSGIAAAAGALIGGSIGKNRQIHENNEGKKVGDPKFWNKEAAIGGLLGWAAAGVAAVATGVAAIATALFTASAAPAAAPVVAGAGIVAVLGSIIAAPVIGTYIGGKIGQRKQAAEYEEAKKQTIVRHISTNVSPEAAHLVENAMEHNKNWGKEIGEQRLLNQARGL